MTTTTEAPAIIPTAPVNGMPTTLADEIADEARAFREIGTTAALLIAEAVERLAQTVRWTGATTAAEHRDRLTAWDESIADRHFDRGYTEGYEAARRELGARNTF